MSHLAFGTIKSHLIPVQGNKTETVVGLNVVNTGADLLELSGTDPYSGYKPI